jgi:hypothetical protein
MPAAKRSFQLAELVARPPTHEGAESIPILDAAAQVFANERHETEAPGKILSLQVGLRVTMLVKYHVTWFVHEYATSPNNSKEDVKVAAAGQGRTSVQCIVKAAGLTKKITSESHVASRSEDPRAAGIERILRQ